MIESQNMGKKRTFPPRTAQNNHSEQPKPRKPRGTRSITYMTEEELERLFRVIDDPRDAAIFRLMAGLGLRSCEPGRLQLADYRERTNRLYVRRAKGSNDGEYALGRQAGAALRKWIRRRGTRPGPLFLSRNRRAISRRMLDVLIKRYCALAGIDRSKAHCHCLKHTAGTLLAESGEDAIRIQDWLGHRNIQNTMKYLHLANRERDAVADRRRDKW